MRKLLIISNDIERVGATPGAHTFRAQHEAKLREAAGNALSVTIAAPEEAPPHFAEAEIVAAFPMRVPELSLLPSVKWIHSFSAGVDKILTPEVVASSVIVTNSSGVHATPIAEHLIGFLLMFTRGFSAALRAQEKRQWLRDATPDELFGKTVLVVGLGEIGTEFARLAAQFGTRIWAVSRSGKGKPAFVLRLETPDMLDAMLPEADFVAITLPGTSETHHLFDAKKFALMKPSAVLLNIGRGSIVREADLIDALQAGTIAGAGLDVFEQEPLPPESVLWDMENVIITPHNSGLSHRYMDRAVELLCDNLRAYLKGEVPGTLVDKRLGY